MLVEPDSISREAADALRNMGYELKFAASAREFAHATALVKTKDGWVGTADPRVGGGAAGD